MSKRGKKKKKSTLDFSQSLFRCRRAVIQPTARGDVECVTGEMLSLSPSFKVERTDLRPCVAAGWCYSGKSPICRPHIRLCCFEIHRSHSRSFEINSNGRQREGGPSRRFLTSDDRLCYLHTLGGPNSLFGVCGHFLGALRLMYSLTETDGNQIIGGRLF